MFLVRQAPLDSCSSFSENNECKNSNNNNNKKSTTGRWLFLSKMQTHDMLALAGPRIWNTLSSFFFSPWLHSYIDCSQSARLNSRLCFPIQEITDTDSANFRFRAERTTRNAPGTHSYGGVPYLVCGSHWLNQAVLWCPDICMILVWTAIATSWLTCRSPVCCPFEDNFRICQQLQNLVHHWWSLLMGKWIPANRLPSGRELQSAICPWNADKPKSYPSSFCFCLPFFWKHQTTRVRPT